MSVSRGNVVEFNSNKLSCIVARKTTNSVAFLIEVAQKAFAITFDASNVIIEEDKNFVALIKLCQI